MKRSKNKYDVYIWLEKVARSVQTTQQMLSCYRLIKIYSERYDVSFDRFAETLNLMELRDLAFKSYYDYVKQNYG